MSVVNNIRALYHVVRLEIMSTIRYKFSVISDVLVFTILFAFFMASNTGMSFGERYGYDDYKALLLFGYLAWTLAIAALSSSINSVSTELLRGTFYRKLHSRCNLTILMFGELIATILVELVVVIALLALAYGVWNISIMLPLMGVISIIVCTIGMYGMGLIVGGLTILYKRVGSLILLFQLGLLFVTDTIPTNSTVLLVTRCIPLTICNEIIRSTLAGVSQTNNFLILLVLSIVWLVVGKLFFDFCIKNAKQKGNLLFY